MKENKKGISLIVLVITIIVMIILASAVIISLSNSNIIERADEAVDKTDETTIKELATLAWLEAYDDGVRDRAQLESKVKEYLLANGITEQIQEKYIITVTTLGVSVITQNGNVNYTLEEINSLPYVWAVAENKNNGIEAVAVYDETTKTLKIQRNGTAIDNVVMKDYTSQTIPWAQLVSNIEHVIIYDGIANVGNYAFYKFNKLKSVEMADSVTSIGTYTFYNCTGLTSIDLPSSLMSIGRAAFDTCTGLTSIDLPSSLTSIGNRAFCYCTGLTGSVIIPQGVTTIEGMTFYECYGITSVVIPQGVTTIEANAFTDCRSLKSLVLPDGLTSIGNRAFLNCHSLETVYIPSSVIELEEFVFAQHPTGTIFTFGEGFDVSLSSISNNAFIGVKCEYAESTFATTYGDGTVTEGIHGYKQTNITINGKTKLMYFSGS